jgi:hypothetical protein
MLHPPPSGRSIGNFIGVLSPNNYGRHIALWAVQKDPKIIRFLKNGAWANKNPLDSISRPAKIHYNYPDLNDATRGKVRGVWQRGSTKTII